MSDRAIANLAGLAVGALAALTGDLTLASMLSAATLVLATAAPRIGDAIGRAMWATAV